jgi:hypothetical protein
LLKDSTAELPAETVTVCGAESPEIEKVTSPVLAFCKITGPLMGATRRGGTKPALE